MSTTPSPFPVRTPYLAATAYSVTVIAATYERHWDGRRLLELLPIGAPRE